MPLATDIANILASGPRSAAYVFGSESGRGSFLLDDVEMPDDAGGTRLVRVMVLRVPVAKLTSVVRGNTIVIGGTSYSVRDTLLNGGGEIREIIVV